MLSVYVESSEVRVYIDISLYWPRDDHDEPRSVNSVYEEIKDTPDVVGRNTLRLALEGRLDRGYFVNQVKLARLASKWAGREISVTDLLKIEDEGKQHFTNLNSGAYQA